MKRTLISKTSFILLITFLQFLQAQTPDFGWAKIFGKLGSECTGSGIVTDGQGNLYVAGCFSATCDFDPGPGVSNMTSGFGFYDAYVCKLDTIGNLVWSKHLGGSYSGTYSMRWRIELDGNGNIYLSGNFNGTADFDPGAGTYNMTAVGGSNTFACKLDNDGNFLWAKQFGGQNFEMSLDNSSNVYLTGTFSDSSDFDPGIGTNYITSGGGRDIYIAKLDSSGNFLWAYGFGDIFDDDGFGVTTDAVGNVYLTGSYGGTVDFDPSAGTNNLTAGGGLVDIYVCKLNSSGNFINAKSIGGPNSDYGYEIKVDGSGSILINGSFGYIVDFDPGAGIFNLTASGGNDVFLAKFDTGINFVWAVNQVAGSGLDALQDMDVDVSGDIYSTGFFMGIGDFDPGADTFNLSSGSYVGAYVSKIDHAGNFIWAGAIEGISTSFNYGRGITVDNVTGNVYATGNFNNTADFDMGTDSFDITCPGTQSTYILNLKQNIIGLGIDGNGVEENILAYPNPTDGATNIDLGKVYEDVELVVKNISGQILTKQKFHSTDNISLVINQSPGMYFVEIFTYKGALVNLKILKN